MMVSLKKSQKGSDVEVMGEGGFMSERVEELKYYVFHFM